MLIKTVKFTEIVPDDFNARKTLTQDDVKFQRIKTSLEVDGYLEPVVFNEKTGHIVDGHLRVSVMQYMGKTEAEMSIVNLTDHDEKLLHLRLNRIRGRWDYDVLEKILAEFTLDEALLTGFGSEELAVMLAEADDWNMDDYDDDFDMDDEEDAEEEEDDEVPDDFEGASWVITLKFPSAADAARWCKARGHEGAVKENARTTVIRIGEG